MSKRSSKVAIVTGGAAGLGRAIAQRLAADGAELVITDIRSDVGVAAAAELGFTFLQQDVGEEARWTEIIRQVEHRFGRLDILVNNAGILGPMDAVNPEEARLEDWRKIFAVNVEGVFLGCREAIPAIARAGGGAIVNISSIAGMLATPYATAYGASKAAVWQLTKSVAQHCAQRRLDIRCNSIHPGDVLTPLWLKRAEESATARGIAIDVIIAEGKSYSPSREFIMPEDVAAAVAFLVSDDARHITGTKMIVDGGIMGCDTYHMMAKQASGEGARSADPNSPLSKR